VVDELGLFAVFNVSGYSTKLTVATLNHLDENEGLASCMIKSFLRSDYRNYYNQLQSVLL